MKIYCGTDIIEVNRIKKSILENPKFKERVFSPSEIAYADTKSNITKYQHYAGRFAAKEAIFKCLSNITSDLHLCEIEIINNETNGKPNVHLKNAFLNELIKTNKLDIDVSISHIKEYACANAVSIISF